MGQFLQPIESGTVAQLDRAEAELAALTSSKAWEAGKTATDLAGIADCLFRQVTDENRQIHTLPQLERTGFLNCDFDEQHTGIDRAGRVLGALTGDRLQHRGFPPQPHAKTCRESLRR